MATLRWGAATDPGRIRPENEDNLVAEPHVFAVADGMGGHRAGEVASALAVDLLRSRLAAPGAHLDDVVAAIADANGDIYRAAIGNPDQQGMGTTITALVVISRRARTRPTGDGGDGTAEQLALVNVGDSRTYLLRHGRLRRVTVDHSYVQELVATGHITDDEARTHPRRNIVTRALGIDPAVRVDAWTLPLVRGDRFVLCSDGLVDEVRDDEILERPRRRSPTRRPPPTSSSRSPTARAGGTTSRSSSSTSSRAPSHPTPTPSSTSSRPGTTARARARGRSTIPTPRPPSSRTSPRSSAARRPAATATTADVDGRRRRRGRRGGPPGHGGDAGDRAPPPARARASAASPASSAASACSPCSCWRFVIAAAWARRGFFVAFDDADAVVIYRGQNGGFLWFDPTVEAPTVFVRDQLDDDSIERVEREPGFDSRRAAERFVAEQLETTTTIDDHHHDDHDHGPGHDDHADDRRAVMTGAPGPGRRRLDGRRRRRSPAHRRSTELSLVIMAGVITAGAYTLASLGEYAVIPARIVPFLAVLLGLLVARPPRRALVRPAAPTRRCCRWRRSSTGSAT